MKPQIIYIYDAYCAWSYAFSNVVAEFKNRHATQYDFEVYSGGLITPTKPVPMEIFTEHYWNLSKEVTQKTGVAFGSDFMWHVENPGLTDWYPNSTKPAIALAVFRTYLPDLQVEFARDLGAALFSEGRDLYDDEAYRHLLLKYNLPINEFYDKLQEKDFLLEAQQEFEITKKLAPGGYPSLLVRSGENKFIQLAVGYSTIEEIENMIQQKTPE